MGYRTELPYNRQQGTDSVPDATASIFSQAYIEGVPLGYEAPLPPNATSQTVDDSTSELDDPNWILDQGPPAPEAKSSGPSNGRWYYWDGTKPLTVQLHNNEGILAVWLPQEPPQIITVQSGMGASGGIGIYNTTPYTSGEQVASEMIGIPSGHESLTLTSSAAFTTAILVLVSGEPYPPSKTFLSTVTSANITASITLPVNNNDQTFLDAPPSVAQGNITGGAGPLILVPAVAGKRVYVFAYSVSSWQTAAGGFSNTALSDTGGGTNFTIMALAPSTAAGLALTDSMSSQRAILATPIGLGLECGVGNNGQSVVAVSYLQV